MRIPPPFSTGGIAVHRVILVAAKADLVSSQQLQANVAQLRSDFGTSAFFLSLCLSIYESIYLPACLSVLSVCLSVCLSVSLILQIRYSPFHAVVGQERRLHWSPDVVLLSSKTGAGLSDLQQQLIVNGDACLRGLGNELHVPTYVARWS